jgi:hypothetical protein
LTAVITSPEVLSQQAVAVALPPTAQMLVQVFLGMAGMALSHQLQVVQQRVPVAVVVG